MAQEFPVPLNKFSCANPFYIPVIRAIAAIMPRNNKIIPIATNVSCSSTELIFIT